MLRLAAATTALTLTLAGTAAASTVNVPAQTSDALANAQSPGIPVLLPARADLDVNATKLFAHAYTRPGSYTVTLTTNRSGLGDAGRVADFMADKGAPLGYRATNVNLALGLKGYFQPQTAGSRAPASIQWIEKGVRYEIQARALGGQAAFTKMADSAIVNGNRA